MTLVIRCSKCKRVLWAYEPTKYEGIMTPRTLAEIYGYRCPYCGNPLKGVTKKIIVNGKTIFPLH